MSDSLEVTLSLFSGTPVSLLLLLIWYREYVLKEDR